VTDFRKGKRVAYTDGEGYTIYGVVVEDLGSNLYVKWTQGVSVVEQGIIPVWAVTPLKETM